MYPTIYEIARSGNQQARQHAMQSIATRACIVVPWTLGVGVDHEETMKQWQKDAAAAREYAAKQEELARIEFGKIN